MAKKTKAAETKQATETAEPIAWPDPTPEMLDDPLFRDVFDVIKGWDIAVPGAYGGYCYATGNHARAIYDAVRAGQEVDDALNPKRDDDLPMDSSSARAADPALDIAAQAGELMIEGLYCDRDCVTMQSRPEGSRDVVPELTFADYQVMGAFVRLHPHAPPEAMYRYAIGQGAIEGDPDGWATMLLDERARFIVFRDTLQRVDSLLADEAALTASQNPQIPMASFRPIDPEDTVLATHGVLGPDKRLMADLAERAIEPRED